MSESIYEQIIAAITDDNDSGLFSRNKLSHVCRSRVSYGAIKIHAKSSSFKYEHITTFPAANKRVAENPDKHYFHLDSLAYGAYPQFPNSYNISLDDNNIAGLGFYVIDKTHPLVSSAEGLALLAYTSAVSPSALSFAINKLSYSAICDYFNKFKDSIEEQYSCMLCNVDLYNAYMNATKLVRFTAKYAGTTDSKVKIVTTKGALDFISEKYRDIITVHDNDRIIKVKDLNDDIVSDIITEYVTSTLSGEKYAVYVDLNLYDRYVNPHLLKLCKSI